MLSRVYPGQVQATSYSLDYTQASASFHARSPTHLSSLANLPEHLPWPADTHTGIRPYWPGLAWPGHPQSTHLAYLQSCSSLELPTRPRRGTLGPGTSLLVKEVATASRFTSWRHLLASCPFLCPRAGRASLSPGSKHVPPPVPHTSGTMETQACLHSHQSYSETWARLRSQCRHLRPKNCFFPFSAAPPPPHDPPLPTSTWSLNHLRTP